MGVTYRCSKCHGTGSQYEYLADRVKNLELALKGVWPWLPAFIDEATTPTAYKDAIEFAKQFIKDSP